MKKFLATALAFCLVIAVGSTALAGDVTQDSAQSASTELTYDYQADPTYTVAIPASISLAKDGSQANVSASNVANLNGKKISVSIAGTSAYRDQFILAATDVQYAPPSMRFSITKEDGTVLLTNAGAGIDNYNGTELVSFDGDGTKSFTVAPVPGANTPTGHTYAGSITYGIALV